MNHPAGGVCSRPSTVDCLTWRWLTRIAAYRFGVDESEELGTPALSSLFLYIMRCIFQYYR